MYILEKLNAKKVTDLRTIAKELNISEYEKLKKQELAYAILDHQAENTKSQEVPIKQNKPKINNPLRNNQKKPRDNNPISKEDKRTIPQNQKKMNMPMNLKKIQM